MTTKNLSFDALDLQHIFEQAASWSSSEDLETIRNALDTVTYDALRSDGSKALFDAFEHSINPRTKTLLRGALFPNEPSPLRHLVNAGEVRMALTFAGQAQDYMQDLERLYQIAESRTLIDKCCDALVQEFEAGARLSGLHPLGIDARRWVIDPSSRPDSVYLASSAVSQPLIFVTQMAQFIALGRIGFESDRIREWCVATTGHSQGIMPAIIAAEGLETDALIERAALVTRYMLWQGIEMQSAFGPALSEGHAMAAVTGLDLAEVETYLADTSVCISLHNAFRRVVISGHPHEIEAVLSRIDRAYQRLLNSYEAGQSSRPPQPLIERLSVSAPFHSSLVADCMPALRNRMTLLELDLSADDSVIPVVRYETGKVWEGECIIESQTINQVRWPVALKGLRDHGITHIIDAGPGAGVSAISALEVRGYGIGVIPVATQRGEYTLLSGQRVKGTASRAWATYAPTLVTRGNGTTALENQFTKTTGYPPIFVPGMTPTTVEAPIIAESANAGYLAELAGGGQTSEMIFRERAEELRERLKPGTGYLINTLYLDPYLWQLQIGKQRLVQKLRHEGHPILGVTISAGIPPTDEALELLKEFEGLGMYLNSLKVGSAEQIQQALEIADAHEGTIILQVEGGAAGGHHSFESLEAMLLTWYARIRRRQNCLLTVGGGIGNSNRVAELLNGTWSERFGLPKMPVDAVYLGTALMACKEVATSKAVKKTLVATKGTPKFVGRGLSVGGVRSGRSGLGADIHYVDNHAAKTSAFLDSVAGDAAKVAASRDKIIDMLSRTAKPYFGDVCDMTYLEMLERLVELMALGQGTRYQDGVWLDITHRQRFHSMLLRALKRVGGDVERPTLTQLDAPRQLLRQLKKLVPLLDKRRVLMEDQKFFVNSVCSTPGKPVPFVPNIDENVRRWYCSDSLWQAHDDRYTAESVLIIPGPNAVHGIEAADVPVATMLSDFLEVSRATTCQKRTDPMPCLMTIGVHASELVTPHGVKPNPLAKLMSMSLPHVDLNPIDGGLRLKIRHSLPLRGYRDLTVDFVVKPFEPKPLRVTESMMTSLRLFYKKVMPQELAIDPERISAYRRITSDRGPSTPEQFFFAVTLPKIMQRLLDDGLGLNPASLLHLSSEIHRRSFSNGGMYTANVRQVTAEDGVGGRTVIVDCDVTVGRTLIAQCQQQFLVRETSGVIGETFKTVPLKLEREVEHRFENARNLFEKSLTAPLDLNAFSHISGDLNPIHRDAAVAVLAGLDGPIVHGQWTAATACGLLVAQDRRLLNSRADFLGPVQPGETLIFKGQVTGLSAGHEICVVEVSNAAGPVLRLTATRECQPTALIFPGQGSQRKGMGMEQYDASPAARKVWDRADRHTRGTYGFSILRIVRENPKYLRVADTVVEHPEGVLNVTQFTQVALTVLSVAGVADLRAKGIFSDDSWFCGHSVGEYSALCAVTDLFSLENLVDAVYHRGITMQEYVERDERGRSDYVMGVIRPNRLGIDGATAIELIEEIHAESGFPLYVVNHNVADRQYAVAGHVKAVEALRQKVAPNDPKGEGWINIPGIDVPFHSPLLADGVDAFRDVLEKCIPKDVDIERLVHRYIPNLVARPFELTESFLDDMIEATGHVAMEELRSELTTNGRAVLIELLAWQFASPVRWIETQVYLNATVKRTIEVGPKSAPVLTNMFLSGYRDRPLNIDCLHASRDAAQVLGAGIVEAAETSDPPSPPETVSNPTKMPNGTDVSKAPHVEVNPPTLEDAPWGVRRSLFALLALRLNKPMGELSDTDTIDELLGGNSARRNQVLLDLGKEFGVGAIDGAHELGLHELSDQLEGSVGLRYTHPGPCLKAAQNDVLRVLSTNRKAILGDLTKNWSIGSQRSESVLTTLAIHPDLLESSSPTDAAVARYCDIENVQIGRPSTNTGAQTMVDAGAVSAIKQETQMHWKSIAKAALRAADLDPTLVDRIEKEPAPMPADESEAQSFDPKRYMAFTQTSQWVKADATQWFFAIHRGNYQASTHWIRAASEKTIAMLEALSTRYPLTQKGQALVKRIAKQIAQGLKSPLPYQDEVAIVTGAGPRSIAEAIVAKLLEGGATVVVSCSRLTEARRAHFRNLYRQHAGRLASLHVVPLNQGNLDDVADFAEWIYNAAFEVKGADRILIKAPWSPTLFFPFGAMPAEGDPTTLDEQIIRSLTVNLIGVEALVGQLALQHREAGLSTPICAVLPLSPNHGQMGRDGLYAEAKIGLEALMQRRAAEFERWGRDVMLIGARIGWVRGTGLMAALDRVYEKVEADLGIQTFAPEEMADLILERLPSKPRIATTLPGDVHDFTGGFSEAEGLRDTINQALGLAAQQHVNTDSTFDSHLPYYQYDFPKIEMIKTAEQTAPQIEDAICIVGFGEIGPLGNARIRWDYEVNAKQLSLEAQLELAKWCGCIEFKNMEWVDAESGEPTDVGRLEETYHLSERIGIRQNEQFDPQSVVSFTEVILTEDTRFNVPDAETAAAYEKADPEFTQTFLSEDGYTVLRKKGSRIRVPKLDPIDRTVAGQLPTGFNATSFGIDAQSLDQIDPVAIYNLLSTADAFRSAGLTPEELWQHVHPARIACTQGSGIGGMRAQYRLYAASQLGENKQGDVLQETLINVAAAYAGMMYHGGYGPMINPVSACATAAISVEIATDLLRQDKADFVVAGAFDDFGKEGARGFAEMQATIDTKTCKEKGIVDHRASRPCDARRGGFVESQGGGTVLMCRMRTALEMGLPIYGVVAGAWSGSDGIQRSVPAPGPGILRIGAGQERSPLSQALATLSLSPDDLGVVSLHGTSTLANDKNETQLHSNLANAIGRDTNLPMLVVAQKAITGHAKGGAAAWQLNGLLQAMRDDVIPGMWNLDEPDPSLKKTEPLVFSDQNVQLPVGGLKAGLITSLGFGHVAGAVCVAHPTVVLEQLCKKDKDDYVKKRAQREATHREWSQAILLGDTPLFEARLDRPYNAEEEHRLLLTPSLSETS